MKVDVRANVTLCWSQADSFTLLPPMHLCETHACRNLSARRDFSAQKLTNQRSNINEQPRAYQG